MTTPTYDPRWSGSPLNLFIYEWLRNCHGLTHLRESCSTACWMSDAGWTEWKSYSHPRYTYVASLPERTPHSIFKSATLGTRSLFVCASTASEMSTQVRKNVRQLRISKSLTCDELSVKVELTSRSATMPSRRFVYG